MDEPFSSLDAPTRETCRTDPGAVGRTGLTMVIVTHAIEEAAVLGRKILLLGAAQHAQPLVIDNPASADPGFRDTPAYLALLRIARPPGGAVRRRDLLMAVLAAGPLAGGGLAGPAPDPAGARAGWTGFHPGAGRGSAGHFLASLWRVLSSTFLAIALAAPAGLVLGQSRA
jgi:energy-coupling factor transporter ATP-binding protein EcfA2